MINGAFKILKCGSKCLFKPDPDLMTEEMCVLQMATD